MNIPALLQEGPWWKGFPLKRQFVAIKIFLLTHILSLFCSKKPFYAFPLKMLPLVPGKSSISGADKHMEENPKATLHNTVTLKLAVPKYFIPPFSCFDASTQATKVCL